MYNAMETEQEETDVNGAQTNYRLYIFLKIFLAYSLGNFVRGLKYIQDYPHTIVLQR